MGSNLQSSLESLNKELARADEQLTAADQRAGKAVLGLGEMLDQFKTRAKNLLPPAQIVTDHLAKGQKQIDHSMIQLHTDLDALQTELRLRMQSTLRKVADMLEAVRGMSSVLQRVNGEIRAEQERTEAALNLHAERSKAAFARSREAMENLDRFARDEFLPRLNNHETGTDQALDRISRTVADGFVPGLETMVKVMLGQINQMATQLREHTQALAEATRLKAEESMQESSVAARQSVATLAEQTGEAGKELQRVVVIAETELDTERKAHAHLMEVFAKAEPDAADMITIPVNLRKVLQRAKVIP